ncbi:MAG: TolC family protein [Bacteroidales bacterium]|nr:TolC family protein [Bacteroidales bacterium]
MNWIKKILIAAVIFFMSLLMSLFAQEVRQWSLEDCIDYALKNNIQIKQQLLNEELSRQDALLSKGAFLPNLNGFASHSYNYGRTVDRFTNEFAESQVQSNNFYVSSQATLFSGFRIYNSFRQTQLILQASGYETERYKNDIALGVATAYLNVLFSKSLFDNAKLQINATEIQLNRTRKLTEAGVLSEINALNMEAQFASEELTLINAENQLSMAYLSLVQMLDLKEVGSFSVIEPNIQIDGIQELLLTPFQVYEISIKEMPEIQAGVYRLKAAQKGLLVARSGYSPQLTIQGSIGTGFSGASREMNGFTLRGLDTIGFVPATNDVVVAPGFSYNYATKSFEDQINDNLNQTIGFNLSIPLFNGFQVKSSVNRAKIGLKMAEYNNQLIENQLFKSIQQAHADALAALKRYHSANKAMKAFKLAYEQIEVRYNIGSSSFFEFSDAKAKFNKASNDLIQAKYDYIFKSKIIDFYMGKPLQIERQ